MKDLHLLAEDEGFLAQTRKPWVAITCARLIPELLKLSGKVHQHEFHVAKPDFELFLAQGLKD